ncbi:hypothetical protein NDU88_010075 [Pleurodeles waltl]|uniref:Uncharacterized protein n=1 Tax=Pleurodeles waltl TaxID=8319 RepID=A0AAV7RY37_PLEWA|nr:hypothetical protein NDU88_010075 [Pleurodeles waltl]
MRRVASALPARHASGFGGSPRVSRRTGCVTRLGGPRFQHQQLHRHLYALRALGVCPTILSPSAGRTRRPARPAQPFKGVKDVCRWATVAGGDPTSHTGPTSQGRGVSAGKPGADSLAASPPEGRVCGGPSQGRSDWVEGAGPASRKSAKSNRHAGTGCYLRGRVAQE